MDLEDPIVKQAQVILLRLTTENEAAEILQEAMSNRDIDVLRDTTEKARELLGEDAALDHPLLLQATALMHQLEKEKRVLVKIEAAIESRSLNQITEALEFSGVEVP